MALQVSAARRSGNATRYAPSDTVVRSIDSRKGRLALESFSILTELAAAIAGFSGITIAIQARAGNPDAIAVFRNKNLISWSLGAAFGSTLPQAVFHVGARGPQIWIWSSFLYSLILSTVIVGPFIARHSLTLEERSRLSPLIWISPC